MMMSEPSRVAPITRRAFASGALGAAVFAVAPRPARADGPGGFDPAMLSRAADAARRLDQLNALVVSRDGETAFAEAFRGPSLERAVNVKSVSKTIVAALAGAAFDRGALAGPETLLVEAMPRRIPSGADPRVREITLGDLLTMQAGLERTSGANYGGWVSSRNWVADALTRPFVAEPGARFLYSTGSYHLLGAALAEATGESLLGLARAWLGAPLGVDIPPWTRDPQGFYLGGNNMALSPMALLRFGEMARLGGLWRGERVLSASWLEASWTPRTRSPFSGHDYGYGWFLAEAQGAPVAYARGYGGQMIYVAPSLGLTVVATSDPTRPARSGGHVGDLNALFSDIAAAARAA